MGSVVGSRPACSGPSIVFMLPETSKSTTIFGCLSTVSWLNTNAAKIAKTPALAANVHHLRNFETMTWLLGIGLPC